MSRPWSIGAGCPIAPQQARAARAAAFVDHHDRLAASRTRATSAARSVITSACRPVATVRSVRPSDATDPGCRPRSSVAPSSCFIHRMDLKTSPVSREDSSRSFQLRLRRNCRPRRGCGYAAAYCCRRSALLPDLLDPCGHGLLIGRRRPHGVFRAHALRRFFDRQRQSSEDANSLPPRSSTSHARLRD